MNIQATTSRPAQTNADLRNYYLARGLVAAGWVAAAFTVGQSAPLAAAALLVAYPAWDALANLFDAARSGGLAPTRRRALRRYAPYASCVRASSRVDSSCRAALP